MILRTSSAHEEGGERLFSVATTELVDDGSGAVRALRLADGRAGTVDGRPAFVPVPGSDFELEAELVLIAMGFLGPEVNGCVAELGLALDARGNVAVDASFATTAPGRLRLRRHGPRPEPDRLGDRRGTLGGRGRRPLPDGRNDLPAPIVPGQLALR